VGFNVVADNTGCLRLAIVAAEIWEILRNSPKIRTYSSSRSSKVIELGVNRKLLCNFLLVINSKGRISYRFRDIDALSSNTACFTHPSLV